MVHLLGGFALQALLGYLLAARAAGPGVSTAGAGLLLLMVAVAAQSGGGALISARLAGDACAAGCATAWLPGAGALIDPALPGAAAEIAPPRAGQALHLWHRLGGLVLTLTTIVAVFATLRGRSPRAAAVAMLAAAATGALGFAVATDPPALPAAAAHALVAGLLVASLAVAWAQRGWTSGEVGT